MELDKVMKLVNNLDKERGLIAQIDALLDVGGEPKPATEEAAPAKRRGRPRKAKAEDLNFE